MIRLDLSKPEPISSTHNVEQFDSGEPSLDHWLKRQALKNEVSGASRTYVVVSGTEVCGYYCLAAGAVIRDDAPKSLQRNMPDPLPVMVLGRLAVDRWYQDRGIGSALLRDANQRTILVADVAGITALLVHAISVDARSWYLSRGFLESPIHPMTLCLPLTTVRRALADPG